MLDFYKNKRVFLTGHTGFKGTWLARILARAGADVTGYALEPPTEPSLFELTGTEKDIRHIYGDVRDRERLAKAVTDAEPDIVFHLAAQPIVRLSYREPVDTYETNVMGTVNILEAIRSAQSVISFINVTTDKVYKNREWLWGYREDENLCGYDPYSNSKSCSELVTYSYRKSFFSDDDATAISSARSGNVIGGGDYAQDRIIPDCVRAVNAGAEIVIRNPRSTRPYQHVLECLAGYLILAEKQYGDKTFEGAYNFGPDEESCVTNEELVNLFCGAWGGGASWIAQGSAICSLNVNNKASGNINTNTNVNNVVSNNVGNNGNVNDNGDPHEANYLRLDCSKAKTVLGWRPRWSIKTAVERVVDFAKIGVDTGIKININANISANGVNDELTACVDRQIEEYFDISK